jgi:hypothetical protein
LLAIAAIFITVFLRLLVYPKIAFSRKLKGRQFVLIERSRMHKFLSIVIIASCFLANFWVCDGVFAQSPDEPALQLQGFVWDHTILNTLVVTSENESWWSNTDLNTALRAIGQWNEAIATFALNYSEFSYLSNLSIQSTVSNTSEPGYDIYVQWTTTPFSNTTDEIGLSQISANYQSIIINCTVSLSAHTGHGDSLNEADKQNVALHELGHSLGLGHSNSTNDLMYAYYTRGSGPEEVSTLDVYGVATLFAWEQGNVSFYPINGWLTENSVILPSNIPYKGLPVSQENTVPQTLANNPVIQTLVLMVEILIHPEIFALVVIVLVIFIVFALIARKTRSKAVKAGS